MPICKCCYIIFGIVTTPVVLVFIGHPGQYLASYVASANIGVIQQWLNSGRKGSTQEMARILSTITVNGPFFAFGLKK